MVNVPDAASQAEITARLDGLATALEQHESWTPPHPHPAILQVWDFVKRSHYIMTELENIRTGQPLRYPDQIPSHEGSDSTENEEKAKMSFTDVITRSLTIEKIVNDPSMMAKFGESSVEFGDEVKAKSKAVQDAIMALPE